MDPETSDWMERVWLLCATAAMVAVILVAQSIFGS
jgi:hypothetical protein